jgi:hypothetical protein
MSDADRAFDRLVATNPVPPSAGHSTAGGPIPEWTGPSTPTLPTTGRSWRPVAVVTAIVLAATVAVLTVDGDDGRPVAGTDPVGTVEAFFEHWNRGDVEAAMSLVHPDAVVNRTATTDDLRDFMAWVVELDGFMAVDCVAGSGPGRVSCDWSFVSAAVDALGLPGASGVAIAVGGRGIESLTTPDYSEFERQIAAFARDRDPPGFAAECGVSDGAASSSAGFTYTPECGTFFAELEAAFVDSLSD